jgi:DNA-binding cell septation regulator SpoVG
VTAAFLIKPNPKSNSLPAKGTQHMNSPFLQYDLTPSLERLRLLPSDGNLRAIADVRVGPLLIRGVRVIQQPGNRPYMALPQTLIHGNTFVTVLSVDDEGLKDAIRGVVLAAYGAELQKVEVGA